MVSNIFTQNIYVRISLSWLLDTFFPEREISIIDLDSFFRLEEIILATRRYALKSKTEFYFVGNKGVLFCLFKKFKVIDSYYYMDTIKKIISKTEGVSFCTLFEHIEACRKLTFLTKQQQIICILRRFTTSNVVASYLNVAPKAVYSVVGYATQRMGMVCSQQLHSFIMQEFSETELLEMLKHHDFSLFIELSMWHRYKASRH